MKLSILKQQLAGLNSLNFVLPDGTLIPKHFHITELGLITKNFIDCGGKLRTEKLINIQIWVAKDTNHRLVPDKLLKIISLSENVLGNEDYDIEIEYQSGTIGRYGLDFQGENFLLTVKYTNCLAKEHCGVPPEPEHVVSDINAGSCTPGGGCC